MKLFIFSISLILNVNIVSATNFVDSLAKEFGKKNGCYSISLNEKKIKVITYLLKIKILVNQKDSF